MADERNDDDANVAGITGAGGDGAGPDAEPATDGNAGLRTVSPDAGTAKRGRGRPPGSKTKRAGDAPATGAGKQGTARKQEKAPAAVVGGIESILYSLHLFASSFVPEAELSEEESKELTQALAAVNTYYAQAIDPKKLAWFALFGIAGKIYGPRVMALMVRLKSDPKPQRVAPLAGAPVKPVAPVTPIQRPPVAAAGNLRAAFSDPTFVADVGAGE